MSGKTIPDFLFPSKGAVPPKTQAGPLPFWPGTFFSGFFLGFFLLSGCSSAPVPLSDQPVLDQAGIAIPDTFPEGSRPQPRMIRLLEKEGFQWNDSRFTLGHHLMKGNEVAWFDRLGNLHITRYTGVFRASGYKIRRYVPSDSGDLEHRGSHVRSSLLLCLFDRPAEALRHHKRLSTVVLVPEVAVGGAIDLVIIPVTIPLCLLSDRLPEKFLKPESEEDRDAVSRILQKFREPGRSRRDQKGNPIPTKVTAPASVE